MSQFRNNELVLCDVSGVRKTLHCKENCQGIRKGFLKDEMLDWKVMCFPVSCEE